MLDELLAAWIGHQRWFGGKGRPIDSLSIDSDVAIEAGDPGLRHLIVSVWQEGSRERYQLLLGMRTELPDTLQHALIGQCGPYAFADGPSHPWWHVYDAAHDPVLTRWVLESMAGDTEQGTEQGTEHGRVRFEHLPGVEIDPGIRSMVLGAEQSNTSLVYGETYICKLFRRLIPGVNPELEVVTALAARHAPHIAQPYGWMETDLDGTATTLAILQEFLSNSTDGWDLALTSVRDLYNSLPGVTAAEAGGDFAAEASRLGAATARVHHELAEAFPTDTVETHEIKRMAEGMRRKLGRAAAEVPELREHVGMLEDAYHRVEELTTEVPVQRVHGDYHLGQVMRTTADWVVLDFEGEPGQPLAERRALSSPLRDVAGMLRSFDYAARHLLAGHAEADKLEPKADQWAERNKAAFLDGYVEGGGTITVADAALLHAFELSKAVYEVVYESRNRPSWVGIPLAAFR
ncbi:maltokinase N-terminal cap-like domain-containing protein [Nonomuraea sp. ZG12]|uniref:maltokinase N-terminal cap-like domain-containing protein n=1 Tax=Nonomuraea sp. ZG12 TaxID=3452207 RepID=UPI003F894042